MKVFVIYRVIMAVVGIFNQLMPDVMALIEKLVRAKDAIIAAIEGENPDDQVLRDVKDKAQAEVESEVVAAFAKSPPVFGLGVIRPLVGFVAYIVGMERDKKRQKEMERQERAGNLLKSDGKEVSVFGVTINFSPGLKPPTLEEEGKAVEIPEDYLKIMYAGKPATKKSKKKKVDG